MNNGILLLLELCASVLLCAPVCLCSLFTHVCVYVFSFLFVCVLYKCILYMFIYHVFILSVCACFVCLYLFVLVYLCRCMCKNNCQLE